MSGPAKIDPRTSVPADGLAPRIDWDAELTWICPVCGRVRVFEGGRPLADSYQNECRECGARLASPLESPSTVAGLASERRRFRDLF